MLTFLFILLLFPSVFQLTYGSKAVYGKVKLKFKNICLISLTAQILISLLGIYLAATEFNKHSSNYTFDAASKEFVGLCALIFFILLIIMGIQLYLRVARKDGLD